MLSISALSAMCNLVTVWFLFESDDHIRNSDTWRAGWLVIGAVTILVILIIWGSDVVVCGSELASDIRDACMGTSVVSAVVLVPRAWQLRTDTNSLDDAALAVAMAPGIAVALLCLMTLVCDHVDRNIEQKSGKQACVVEELQLLPTARREWVL